MLKKFFLFISFLFIVSCASIPTDPSADTFLAREMWTSTNLHVFYNQYLYYGNYLSGEIFPIGTAVRFTEINSQYAVFVDNKNQKFIFYWRGAGSNYKGIFDQEVHKYFSFESPLEKLSKLTEQEMESVKLGEVKRKMTKELVLLSLGHPPNITNPMEKDTWTYWVDNLGNSKKIIKFEGNEVVEVINHN